jgi:S23 ribosomal protein.
MNEGFIPPHGGYRKLLSYQRAEIIYDITVVFCSRFLEKRDRTVDQMIQAARSGKQNIAEGSQAAGTSTETEIKLTNVARASLEELLIDYEDFLRVRGLAKWPKESREAAFVRKVVRRRDGCEHLQEFARTRAADVVANVALCLIHLANFLLDRQIRQLERAFLKRGGIRERMTSARLSQRRYDPRP